MVLEVESSSVCVHCASLCYVCCGCVWACVCVCGCVCRWVAWVGGMGVI